MKTMTQTMQRAKQNTAVMRFILEQFVSVSDVLPNTGDGASRLQERAARILLLGPVKGALSPQQLAFTTLSPEKFHVLRIEVRDWLRGIVTHGAVGTERRLRGPLTLTFASIPGRRDESARKARLGGPLFELPDARELFWLYLFLAISRIGVEQLAVCHAPRSQRDTSDDDSRECGRLYLRRGRAKRFCSDTCRARVATQRARNK